METGGLHGPGRPLRVTTDSLAGGLVVRVAGEVDLVTVDLLAERLRSAEDGCATDRTLIVDLSNVTFLGAAGLHVLVAAESRCTTRGIDLVVVAVHSAVTRPIKLLGLDRSLTVVPDHAALPHRHRHGQPDRGGE